MSYDPQFTHVKQRQDAVVVVDRNIKDQFKLGDDYLQSRCCGEASYQGVRQVPHQEAYLRHTHAKLG